MFLAAVRYAAGTIEGYFRRAAAKDATLESLGGAYLEMLAEREVLTCLLHGFAAAADPAIGPVVRDCFGGIYRTVRELTGASVEQARDFFGAGMLLTVLGAIRVAGPDAVTPEPWMTELLAGFKD